MAKWKSDHIIQKFTFDIDINEKSKFHPLADRLGTIVRNSLTEKIEEALDEVDQFGRVFHINKIEIDLGNVAEKDLERVLKEQMISALKEELLKYMSLARPYSSSSETSTTSPTISASEMAASLLSKRQITNVAREDLLKQQVANVAKEDLLKQAIPKTQQVPTNAAQEDAIKQQLSEQDRTAQEAPTNVAQTDLLRAQIDDQNIQEKQALGVSENINAAQEDALRKTPLHQPAPEEEAQEDAIAKKTITTDADTSMPSGVSEKKQKESTTLQQSTDKNVAQEDMLRQQALELEQIAEAKASSETAITATETADQQTVEASTDQTTTTSTDTSTTSSPTNTAQDDVLRTQQAQIIKREQEAQKIKTQDGIQYPAREDADASTPTVEDKPAKKRVQRRIPDISEMSSTPIAQKTTSAETPITKRRKPFRRGPYYLDTAYEKAQNPFLGKKTPFRGADPANMDVPVYRADYSHQVDGILYFLRRGRLPDWFSLGEATLDDLMIDLLEEHPQIIRPRLKDLVETDVILDRLTEQFLPETLAKIQEITEIEIDDDAIAPLFDVREKASISPFVQATIEEDYLYALFVNGAVPWWVTNVESDNLENIVHSGTGYNFFKALLTQANSVEQTKNILRHILKYLTEVDIQNLFSDYRKNEYGEETLLFIILDIATTEGLHFKDTLVEILKALDGVGDLQIIPTTVEDVETPTAGSFNKDLYSLLADGKKSSRLEALSKEQLEAMMVSATNLSIFSNILSEARSVDAFKNILQRILEYLSDRAIENIFKTYRKENFGRDTLLYKILDTTALEQSTYTTTLTHFVDILQAGRLPESAASSATSPNKDLYDLFADGVQAPWLQYLPAERLAIMMTTAPNLSIFKTILTEVKSTDAFKNILQRILEHLSDTAIESIFKTYRKENFGRDTLLYKILETTELEQSNYKATLTAFIDILQTGRLPESAVSTTSSSPNKDLYALFVEGIQAPWLQHLPAEQLAIMMRTAPNLSIFRTILTEVKSTDAFKNILQRILEHLSDTAIESIFKTYRKENLGRDTLLYKILENKELEQSDFKTTLTTFVDILQAGRLPESATSSTTSPNKDLYDLFADGIQAPWLQYLPTERLAIMMTTVPNLSILSTILTQSKSTDAFKNILQRILEHLSDTAIENIFKTYRKENVGRDTLLYKILDTTAFEQSTYTTTLNNFVDMLQAGRMPESTGRDSQHIELPTDDNKIKDELYELFVNSVEAPWLDNLDSKRWETILLSTTSLAVFKTILTQSTTILSLKNILQNILQYIPEDIIQRVFQTYTTQNLEQDTLLYKILVATKDRPNLIKDTLSNFVSILNTGKIPEGADSLTEALEPATADEIIADLQALLVDGVKAAWIEQIAPKRWETILVSPVGLRFFKDILSLPKPTDLFIRILENLVQYISPAYIQKILQTYRRFDFGEDIVIFRILHLAELRRLNFNLAIIEFTKILKEEAKNEDENQQAENTTPPPVYAMRDDLSALFINGKKAAWIEYISPEKWEEMLSSAIGLKFFKSLLTKPRTIRSLKKVLQNMLFYLPNTLLQKIFSTYEKEDVGQETLLYKILDVTELRNVSFKTTINEFITILDTGKLPTSPTTYLENLEQDKAKEAREKLSLEEKLKQDLTKYKTMTEQAETTETNLSIIEIIDYFLKTASLPTQSKAYDLLTFEQDFKQAIKEQPKQVIDKIKGLSRDAILQNKALGLLTKELYGLLIKKLQPVRATSLLRYFEVVHTLSSPIIQEGLPNLHVILYASKVKAEDINAAHYIQDFVKLVVRENIANPITVIESIQKALRETSADPSVSRDLLGHLEVLKNKTRVSKRLKHQEARKPTEKTSVPYPFKDGALNQAVYIRNAGMVLLWPFLGHYFGRLKMLTPKNTFKTPEMAVRAVHLLQFLTTKHPGSEEHELILNKILCGIPIETPIPYTIALTDEELRLSESLLRAVISQWKALGNSSIDGLRGGFLIRDGRLQKTKSDKWTLRIEKKPYDILLGKLPWGYSMVKISWMPNILTVEWG